MPRAVKAERASRGRVGCAHSGEPSGHMMQRSSRENLVAGCRGVALSAIARVSNTKPDQGHMHRM
eukprot:1455507-Prymnesium_polylepis.1